MKRRTAFLEVSFHAFDYIFFDSVANSVETLIRCNNLCRVRPFAEILHLINAGLHLSQMALITLSAAIAATTARTVLC